MSVKSCNNGGGGGGGGCGGGTIVRCGHLKKLKTSRRKFFVLRDETCDTSARLEYYDSEKKFNAGQPPKRSIPLRTCFNINKRSDTKHKHVIALYTKDDCFCVVLDSDEETEAWLKALLSLQHGEEIADGETPRPTFEHVWQVKVLERGLGSTPPLCGTQKVYRLCLTDKTLSLVPRDQETPQIELSLSNIRSCGSLKNFVFLEVGRSSSIGAGELWMNAEDTNIAQNVHHTVFHAMTTSANSSKEDLNFPRPRSTSESSKQNAGARRPKTSSFNQDPPHSNDFLANPPSTASSTTRTNAVNGLTGICQLFIQRATTRSSERRHSIAGGVTCPGIVSHQRTQSLPLAHPAPLTTDHTSHPPRAAKRSNQSSKCFNNNNNSNNGGGGGVGVGRERCDSMPSRPRTTSEGNHPVPCWRVVHQSAPYRPHTICIRDISHSPPSGSPISPPSANCSTDSAGSSLSIDDSEPWPDVGDTILGGGGRYSNSLTPDEAIAEIDEHPDSPLMRRGCRSPTGYVPMNPISSDDGYVDMSPGGGGRHLNMSPAASVSSVTSGTPSTDMRFAEYHLEKVTSYLTPSEEEETGSTDRPIRAYSVGSRPEYACYRTRPELSSTPENSRARAFSVGSKSKRNNHHHHHGRILPPHAILPHHGAKSSSAPILSNSRLHSSNSWMNDHMKLDFSKRNNLSNSGYVEMRPLNRANDGYVDMKPGGKVNAEVSPYVDMRGGSSPAKSSFLSHHHDLPFIDGAPTRNDYVDMSAGRNKKSSPPVGHRVHNVQCGGGGGGGGSGYVDMNFGGRRNDQQQNAALFSTASPVRSSPCNSIDYVEMDVHRADNQTAVEGYVEMSLGQNRAAMHQRQSSLESGNPDYANMNCGTANKTKGRKVRSQPIAIQATCTAQANLNVTDSGSPVMRKYSTGTPPKMFLPLSGGVSVSPFSSLPRQRSTGGARRDSKDNNNSSSSSVTTTPSSSSTIFPISINSPGSPVKQTTKSETPPVTTVKIPASIVNTKYNKTSPSAWTTCKTETEDYIMMDFEKKNRKLTADTSEYVNFSPASASSNKQQPTVPIANDDEFDDYAVMKPGPLGFRPISESKDDLTTAASPKPDEEDKQQQQQQQQQNRTRPGSTTSEELGSSTSTVVGSRPPSVNSERTTRPASEGGGEVQLHYASLDLARAEEDSESRSPRTLKLQQQQAEGMTTSTTTQQGEIVGFTYAEIDFIKSEDLNKQNARVKH